MAGGGALYSSSSSSSLLFDPLSSGNHEVFISFRGEDTRRHFTCHLHGALTRESINVFIDYDLNKGVEISPALLTAIEESYVSVVVFSKHYADSKWCLEELVKIMECRRDHGQVVIPVFYEIDPSHVRNQMGSYKEAFEKHEKNRRVEMNKVQKWKDALTEAANLSGWDSDSRSYRDDSELIQKTVRDVLQKLDNLDQLGNAEGLVGIHGGSAPFVGISKNFTPLELILKEAQSVGIWGMGGIGKTTIARFIFDRCSHHWKGSCFLENVRERSRDHGQGLQNLRKQLYSDLLQQEVCTTRPTFEERRLRRQRNFIVLDDVSSSEQLKSLVGELQSFGPNSRIIITSRDKSVLESTRVECIYTMKELDDEESLKLFSLNAFHEESPKIGYDEMSRRTIVYCKGIPLALKELGSFLNSKSEIEWDSALKELEKIPNEKIQNVLRLSYDGLRYEEQQIFLDIACFFNGEKKEHVIDVLDSCLLFPLFPDIRMRSLLDKSVINISYGRVWMHDLIQQMGREIVRQKSIKNLGNRSHLWDLDDICYVLENKKGTHAIEGINMSQSRQNLCLSSDAFKEMSSLKYLKFIIRCHLQLPNGLDSLSNELRYLKWRGYPWPYLPSNFCAEKLVILKIFDGQFGRLWDGVQNLVNLKKVKLIGCKKLMELPDFSQAQKLKIVNLSGCRSLRHVHPSILSSCGSLETLKLSGCGQVVSEQNPHPIFDGLQSLLELHLDECHHLFELPDNISCLSSLTVLVLDKSNVEKLPESIKFLSALKKLSLRSCRFLQFLPELPSSIHLDIVDCPLLQPLTPKSFNYALREKHKYVSFQNCLNLDQENSLHQYLSEQVQNCLNLDKENSLHQYSSEQVCGYELKRRRIGGAEERQPRSENQLLIAYPGHKVPKWFTYQSKGDSITVRLPPPSDHSLGLLLCVVRSPPTSPRFSRPINIRWKCYLEDGGKQHSIGGIVSEQGTEETGWYRVCISCISGRILEKTNACRANNPSASNSYNPKVTFEFYDQNIKECGVYIVNASNNQTNEVGAGHGTESISEL